MKLRNLVSPNPILPLFVVALLLSPTLLGGVTVADSTGFTVALIPDTQIYAQSYPSIYSAQTQWIRDNAATDNIRFAIHLGDIVNSPTAVNQWQNADSAQAILDGHVPNSVLPGNHDMVNPYDPQTRDSTLYNQYFGPDRYAGYSWYGGHEGTTNNNNYCYFEGGGMEFMVLNLEFRPTAETLTWANGVLAANRNRRVILATHDYIGRWPEDEERSEPGEAIWNNVVKNNPNVFMTVNGHMDMRTSGELVGLRQPTAVNDYGDPVHEMLTDFQFWPNGGDGWLRTLRFEPDENKIYVESYSPTLDQYDTVSPFTLDYDMGEVNPVPPGTLKNHSVKIYFISGKNEDQGLMDHLQNDLGHTVISRSGATASYADAVAAGADLIVISGTLTSSQASGKGFQTSKIPVINYEPFSYDDYGWTGTTQHTDFGDTADNKQDLQIETSSHPITAGVGPGTVSVYTAADGSFSFGDPHADADVLATYQGGDRGDGKATLFVYERGDNLVGATTDDPTVTQAQGRYVGLFLNELGCDDATGDLFGQLNETGRRLVDQTVDYALAMPEAVAHWTFDQDFSDAAGNHHGTPFGGASIASGQGEYVLGGGALRLVKEHGQYLTVDSLAGELQTGDDVTITLWINTNRDSSDMTGPTDNVAFSAHAAGGSQNILRMGTGDDGGVYLNPTNIGGSTPDEENGGGLNDGQWHFLAVTLEDDGTTTVRVYDNGAIVEIGGFTDYAGQPLWSDAALFSIGQEWDSASASNFFDGLIDDVRIYDSVLTQYQIEEIYLSAFGDLLPGDLNADGFVGGDDLDIVRSFWGQNVTAGDLLQGDPSGDGFVGGDDLDIVRSYWGQGTPPVPSAVPEPGTLALLACGLIAVGRARRFGG